VRVDGPVDAGGRADRAEEIEDARIFERQARVRDVAGELKHFSRRDFQLAVARFSG
jgi:hypothetical protein